MAVSSTSVGRVAASTPDASVRPEALKRSGPPVVYAHSAGASPYEAVSATPLPSLRTLLKALADGPRLTTVAPTVVPMFGADVSKVDDAIVTHRASFNGTAAAPVVIGTSAGGPTALRYGMGDGAEAPACVVGLIPAIDLVDLYDNDTGGLRASIGGAYGVTFPTPLPAGADLMSRASELTVPTLLVVASDDVVSTNFAAFAAAAPDVTVVNVGALGHTDAAIAAAIEQVVEFICDNT